MADEALPLQSTYSGKVTNSTKEAMEEEHRGQIPRATWQNMDPLDSKYKVVWFFLALFLVLVTVGVGIWIVSGSQKPVDRPKEDVEPWNFTSLTSIFEVSLVPKGSMEVSNGLGGWLMPLSGNRSCRTDRFEFSAGTTVIIMINNGDCKNFEVDTQGNMSIKVKKEEGARVELKKINMMLTDGRAYSAYLRQEFNDTWSETFLLKQTTKSRKVVIKLVYKDVKTIAKTKSYVENTKIEFKSNGMNTVSCFTNPLPWPNTTGTTTLGDLETLGTCYGLLTEKEDMQVRYTGPKESQFIITNIVLESTEGVSKWFTLPQKTGLSQHTWLTLYYDEG